MTGELPLSGLNILVTREQSQAPAFSAMLQAEAARPIECPMIAISPPSDWTLVDQALSSLEQYDGIFFTSVNGVKFFFNRMKKTEIPLRLAADIPCFAIGPATASALTAQGIQVEELPDIYQAEGLTALLSGRELKGKRFLIPRALRAREVLPEFLREQGAEADVVTVYQTRPAIENKSLLLKILDTRKIDWLTFTSGATVKAFEMMTASSSWEKSRRDIPVACIGEITAAVASSIGFQQVLTARQATLAAMVQILIAHYQEQKR